MGDDNMQQPRDIRSSPRKLRNHSYKESQSATNVKMSGIMLDPSKEDDEMALIPKEDIAKKSTIQKLDTPWQMPSIKCMIKCRK